MQEDFTHSWDSGTHEILPSFRTLINEAERTLDLPKTEPLAWGQKPLVVKGVIVGSFEEEVEGIGVARDVVNVKGENSATPGSLGKQGKEVRWGSIPWVT